MLIHTKHKLLGVKSLLFTQPSGLWKPNEHGSLCHRSRLLSRHHHSGSLSNEVVSTRDSEQGETYPFNRVLPRFAHGVNGLTIGIVILVGRIMPQ